MSTEATVISPDLGLTRHVDIGLRLAASEGAAVVLAKSLASLLAETDGVPVRLAGVGAVHDRLVLTLAIGLGTVEQVKSGDAVSLAAVALVQRIVETLAGYDPAFATLPDPASAEAERAARVLSAPAAGAFAESGLLALIG